MRRKKDGLKPVKATPEQKRRLLGAEKKAKPQATPSLDPAQEALKRTDELSQRVTALEKRIDALEKKVFGAFDRFGY